MNDPVLWVCVAVLAAVFAAPLVKRLVAAIPSVSRPAPASVVVQTAVNQSTEFVPSRYRWTLQEIDSLKWASAQIPETVTVSEFLDQMAIDDMVGETCVKLLSPAKAVAE